MPTLEKFDPSRPLKVAARFVRLHGTLYGKNDALPYSEADHRIIERLYMQRKVTYGDGQEVVRRSPAEAFRRGNVERRRQAKGDLAVQESAENAQDHEAEQAAVTKMVNAHNHEQLWNAARGLKGVKKAMTKGEIALALVRAGREPA